MLYTTLALALVACVIVYVIVTILTPVCYPILRTLTPFTYYLVSTFSEEVLQVKANPVKKILIQNYLFWKSLGGRLS